MSNAPNETYEELEAEDWAGVGRANPIAEVGSTDAELPALPSHKPFSNIGEALAWHLSQREEQLRAALTAKAEAERERDLWKDSYMKLTETINLLNLDQAKADELTNTQEGM